MGEKENLYYIGERIYNLRKKRGLSQEELADKIGVARQTVSKWETNSMIPGTEQLVAMALLFEVTIDDIVLESDHKEERKELAAASLTKIEIPNKRASQKRILFWIIAIVIMSAAVCLTLIITSIIGSSENIGDSTVAVNAWHLTRKAAIILCSVAAFLSFIFITIFIYKLRKQIKEGRLQDGQNNV